MPEAEWQTADDWRPMLEPLAGKFSQRKGTLYVCGGLRCIWRLLYSDSSRQAVEVAERAADDQATREEIELAHWKAECPTFGHDFNSTALREMGVYRVDPLMTSGEIAEQPIYGESVKTLLEMGIYKREDIGVIEDLGDPKIRESLLSAAYITYHLLSEILYGSIDETFWDRLTHQQHWPGGWLVREVFGNPFRPFVIDSAWLTWDGGTVPGIAQGIYEESAFDRLPILADALEDAGCEDRSVLDHCRLGERHVKGCWVVDAVLGLK